MDSRASGGIASLETDPGTLSRPITWREAGPAFAAALIVLGLANHEALWSWVQLWAFAGHEYGFLVVTASGWFIWRSRKDFRAMVPAPSWRALLIVVPVGIAMWFAYLVDVRLAQLVLIIASIGALTWVLLGFAVLRIAVDPILLLVLALPIWNYFKPVLQYMTVQATAFGLQLAGVPVFIDDTYISIPHSTILVLAECSGAQYFQAGVTLGAFHAYLNFRSMWARASVVACFAAASIVGNWIRVLILVSVGKLDHLQHLGVGWIVFACLLVPTFAFSLWLQKRESAPKPVAMTKDAKVPVGQLIALTITASIGLVWGPVTERSLAASADNHVWQIAPIAAQSPWAGPFEPHSGWHPSFHGADAESIAAYASAGDELTAYVAYYAIQKQGREVVNELNRVFGAEWLVRGGQSGAGHYAVAIDPKSTLSVIETRLQRSSDQSERLVWHWYRVAGTDTEDPWRAKVAQVSGRFRGRRDAMVIALSTDARDIDAARELLSRFIVSNYESLRAIEPVKATGRQDTAGPGASSSGTRIQPSESK